MRKPGRPRKNCMGRCHQTRPQTDGLDLGRSRGTERQSAQMTKITNDGLTRSGTGCFNTVVPILQQWASKVKPSLEVNPSKLRIKKQTVKNFDDTFSRFGTILECHRQTDGRRELPYGAIHILYNKKYPFFDNPSPITFYNSTTYRPFPWKLYNTRIDPLPSP